MKKLSVDIVLFAKASLCIAILFLSFAFVPTIAAQCGNGTLDMGEECDDGNILNGDCCDAICNFEPFGAPCGDPSDTECTNPDICTGDGYCSPQHAPGGTPCADDGNICTDDECSGGGVCFHVNNTLPCDDGLYCNGTDSCSDGTCSVHTGDPCTPLFCDEGLNVCDDLESGAMCKGNFDYDRDVDGGDAFVFKTHFGRSTFKNPCPPDGPAPTEKTGQTASYATGDDGEIEKGVEWPNPRFTDNEDGTVTDNLTGLIWLKNANCFGTGPWDDALSNSNGLASGQCGLTDESSEGEWRLPNKRELLSVTSDSYNNPALSNTSGTGQWTEGDPFTNLVSSGMYWSSTTHIGNGQAFIVGMSSAYTITNEKTAYRYIWPVRGGH